MSGDVVVHSDSVAATEALGRSLGEVLQPGDLLALDGELGAGKTCLVRGLVAGLGGDVAGVRSPTFVLHQVHRAARTSLHHLDLYRLPHGADVRFLDLEGLLESGAVAVEWAARADLGHLRPVHLDIAAGADDRRTLRLRAGAPERLRRALTRGARGR